MEILRRRQILTGVAAIIMVSGLVMAILAFQYRDHLPPVEEIRPLLVEFLETIPPVVYFFAFAILPALGVPLTIFYLTAIPVLGRVHPAMGIVLGWTAVALNMSLANLLTRSLLHPAIEWIIQHKHMSIPRISPQSEVKIVLATRLSPVPFFLQNYLLSLGHARWRNYLGLSMLVQGSIGMAVMLLGESILSGGLGYVILALFIFLLLNLVFDHIRNRLKNNESDTK